MAELAETGKRESRITDFVLIHDIIKLHLRFEITKEQKCISTAELNPRQLLACVCRSCT